jgi:molybdenum cofactor cytidylyltransferase
MTAPRRTFGLIPAAGKSTRMGRPKLLLPLAGRTILEHVITAVREAGIDSTLVVVGPHVPDLVLLAETAGADVLVLGEQTPDMRATVEQGLRWLERHFSPLPDDGWLLLPADHPTIHSAVIRDLMDARQRNPQASLVVPTYQGQRGHPALLAWSHVAALKAFPEGLGLNLYLRQHAVQTLEVPVASADILWDLDTPEDYARSHGSRGYCAGSPPQG